jgi:hypothetical protein
VRGQRGSVVVVVGVMVGSDRRWKRFNAFDVTLTKCGPPSHSRPCRYDAPFELEASRDCTVDALCTFFDVDFEKSCANPINLPTGPHTTPTHWKQALMYLAHPAVLKQGRVPISHPLTHLFTHPPIRSHTSTDAHTL